MWDVLVVGDTAEDLVVRPSRPARAGADVPAAITSSPGGQGFNLAWAASAAGAATALVTQVGTDAESRRLASLLRSRKIALPGLLRKDPLTRVVSLVRADGQRTLLTQHGPGPTALPASGWKARALVLSGYLLQLDAGAYIETWLHWAGRREVPVWADLGQEPLPTAWAPYAKSLFGVSGGEEEWDAFRTAVGTRTAFAGVVLLKRGSEGALLMEAGHVRASCPSIPRTPVVDTTGAGDALLGTLVGILTAEGAHANLDRAEWDHALARAVRAAETVVGRVGAVDVS